jgi:LysR family nod box-dependent transcriptional activator
VVSNNIDTPVETLDRADIDILIMPENFVSEVHPRERLFDDEYCCLAWRDNPLVKKKLTVEQYFDLGHVVVRFGAARAPTIDERTLASMDRVRRVEVVAMNFSSIGAYVVGTRRIATIQRSLAQAFAEYLPLKILDAPVKFPRVTQAMQWHKFFEHDPGTMWLRGALKEVASRGAFLGPARAS